MAISQLGTHPKKDAALLPTAPLCCMKQKKRYVPEWRGIAKEILEPCVLVLWEKTKGLPYWSLPNPPPGGCLGSHLAIEAYSVLLDRRF